MLSFLDSCYKFQYEHQSLPYSLRPRRLKQIAAYNVGQCLSSDSNSDIENLNLPQTLDVLVKKFINTYSGDYITDTNES